MVCLACLSARLRLNFKQEFFPQAKRDPVNLWIGEVTFPLPSRRGAAGDGDAQASFHTRVHTSVCKTCYRSQTWALIFGWSWAGAEPNPHAGMMNESSVKLLCDALDPSLQLSTCSQLLLHWQNTAKSKGLS